MTLKADRARDIISRFREQKVLVVGDLILDRYLYGAVERISPEAPVPVVRVLEEKYVPGGASNVAWNVRSLGAQAAVSGIVGRDAAADQLRDLLGREGVVVDGAMGTDRAKTNVKARIIAERQQVVRVDWDNDPDLDDSVVEEFCSHIGDQIAKATAVIIEDYGKGVVQQKIVDRVLAEAAEAGVPTGFDPKDNHFLTLQGVTVATPNDREALNAAGLAEHRTVGDPLKDETLKEACARILEKWRPELLLVTLGPGGMLLVPADGNMKHIPTRAREIFDVSGAGDTVIAACLLALASGVTHEEAAELANHAAGVVVGKFGTAVCTEEELIACF